MITYIQNAAQMEEVRKNNLPHLKRVTLAGLIDAGHDEDFDTLYWGGDYGVSFGAGMFTGRGNKFLDVQGMQCFGAANHYADDFHCLEMKGGLFRYTPQYLDNVIFATLNALGFNVESNLDEVNPELHTALRQALSPFINAGIPGLCTGVTEYGIKTYIPRPIIIRVLDTLFANGYVPGSATPDYFTGDPEITGPYTLNVASVALFESWRSHVLDLLSTDTGSLTYNNGSITANSIRSLVDDAITQYKSYLLNSNIDPDKVITFFYIGGRESAANVDISFVYIYPDISTSDGSKIKKIRWTGSDTPTPSILNYANTQTGNVKAGGNSNFAEYQSLWTGQAAADMLNLLDENDNVLTTIGPCYIGKFSVAIPDMQSMAQWNTWNNPTSNQYSYSPTLTNTSGVVSVQRTNNTNVRKSMAFGSYMGTSINTYLWRVYTNVVTGNSPADPTIPDGLSAQEDAILPTHSGADGFATDYYWWAVMSNTQYSAIYTRDVFNDDAILFWCPLTVYTRSSHSGSVLNNLTQPFAESGDIPEQGEQYIIDSSYELFDAISNGEAVDISTELPPGWVPLEQMDKGETTFPSSADLTAAAFIHVYQMTAANLSHFASWLWNDNGFSASSLYSQFLKILQDPMDAIVSAHIIYADGTVTQSNAQVILGCIGAPTSGAYETVADEISSLVEIDCGSVDISELFGDSRDYTGTTLELFLPWIGFVPLDIQTCMNSTLSISYGIDMVTGDFLARVNVKKDELDAVCFTYSGNCAKKIPLTGRDMMSTASSLISTATSLAAAMSSSGASVAGNVAATAGGVFESVRSSARQISSGNVTGSAAEFGSHKPFIKVKRIIPCEAENYNEISGFGSNKTVTLGDCHGFTRVKSVHVEGFPATDREKAMIEAALKEGVIL